MCLIRLICVYVCVCVCMEKENFFCFGGLRGINLGFDRYRMDNYCRKGLFDLCALWFSSLERNLRYTLLHISWHLCHCRDFLCFLVFLDAH